MAGGAKGEDEGIITDINVTPLVDIILVLLIIFMLTANIIANPSIEVQLPEASTGEATEPSTVALMLTKDNELYLNGVPVDEPGVRDYLARLAKDDPKAQAIIAADKDVMHGRVIHLIDLVRQQGIHKFAINIEPEAAPNAPAP